MTALSRFWAMFVSPGRVFDDVREGRVGWKQPWLLVSIPYMLISWLSLPIQVAITELNPRDLPIDQVDLQVSMMQKMGFVWVILAPLGVLIVTLIVSGLSYMLVTMMSQRANFRQYFTLSLFTGIVGVVGQLIGVVILRLRGVEQIMTADDARMSFSLRMLAPENSAVLKGLLGSVEFFTIWGLVLLGMGLMRIFGMSRGQATAVLVPIWIIYVGMLIAGEVFGGMA
jgi:Na+/melibiose symporter-like transporter